MPEETVQSFASMRSLLSQINQTDDPTQKIALYNQLSEQLNKTTQQYKQLTQEQKNSASASKLQDSKNLFGTKVNTWMNQNTAAAKAFSDRLSDLKSKLWDSDSFRSQKEELEKMASAGTLDESTLSNNERYRQLLDATGKTAKETCDHIYSLVQAEKEQGNVSAPFTKSEMISQINSLSEGFEELDKVMTSIKKKDDVFDYSILDNKNFKENFSGFTTEYNDFVNTVSENPKNIQACQEAFDNLATAFLYNSDVLDGLSDDTANVTTKYLELMGVQNSEEIVSANLAATHAEAAWNAQDLTNATAEEIQQLAAESEQTEVGRQAFAAYIAQKLINSVIDTSGDISALAAEVSQLGISINAWRQYYAAKKDMAALAGATQQTDTYDVGSDNWNELYSQLQNVNGEMSSMIQNLKKWNEELLQLPLTKISNYSSDLNTVKDALTALQDDYTTVISAVTGAIDDETKAIQDQQKEFQKNIEKQKDAIQDKIDLLDKQNTKLQLQQDLEQKLYNLQIANTQKTEKVK